MRRLLVLACSIVQAAAPAAAAVRAGAAARASLASSPTPLARPGLALGPLGSPARLAAPASTVAPSPLALPAAPASVAAPAPASLAPAALAQAEEAAALVQEAEGGRIPDRGTGALFDGALKAADAVERASAMPADPVVKTVHAMLHRSNGDGLDRNTFRLIFRQDRRSYEDFVRFRPDAQTLWNVLSRLYYSLLAGADVPLTARERAAVSSLLHERAARFLSRLSSDPRVAEELRRRAESTRGKYWGGDSDGLLIALTWSRQERARVAAARRLLARERDGADAAAREEAPAPAAAWNPPGPEARVPARAGEGVEATVHDMPALKARFVQAQSRFEMARARRRIAGRLSLGPGAAERERERWRQAKRDFEAELDLYELLVNYYGRSSVRVDFGQADRTPYHPISGGLDFQESARGYRLVARFETKIDDPAVIDAFRRSIEGYWRGSFVEDGRRKRFRTEVRVRVLAPDAAYSPRAVRLMEGAADSAGRGWIRLARGFPFHSPAHEFGHVLGLRDEYENEYRPDAIEMRQRQSRESVMANGEGLILPRHFALVVELARQAGRLPPGR